MSEPAGPSATDDGTGRRRCLAARLERIDAALRQLDAWEAAGQPQTDPRGVPRRPPLRRETLDDLRALLLEELAHLDAGIDT
jgi:hypothetical protein